MRAKRLGFAEAYIHVYTAEAKGRHNLDLKAAKDFAGSKLALEQAKVSSLERL
jgi:hypothetical protein